MKPPPRSRPGFLPAPGRLPLPLRSPLMFYDEGFSFTVKSILSDSLLLCLDLCVAAEHLSFDLSYGYVWYVYNIHWLSKT